MSSPLLRASGLVKRYGGIVATDDVSLSVAPGEVLGIIGPNGAGKSTLVGLLGGALSPSAGRIELDGHDVTALPASERARLGIGRTYQIPRPFLDMTVRENLLAARFAKHPFERGGRARAACDEVLERCGLADMADADARSLPLLRRKRLEMARALALQPRLLLLDEVGAGLVDSEVGDLIGLIATLRQEVQALVIVEHVLRVVRECCDRLLVLHMGKPFTEGPTKAVLASDEVAAVYLGTAARRHAGEGAAPASAASVVPARPAAPAPDNAAQPLLALTGVHAGYGQAKVLRGIDLRVMPGQAVAILGSNGAGKTTLAHVIAGLVRPTSGTVQVDGHDVTRRPAHDMARLGIASCMEGRRIFPSLSVEENLLLAARGASRGDRQSRLDRAYALFPDLARHRRSAGTSMSGGQQQMLAIGRALMAAPRLVVFDEISLGLAPVMMDRLYEALTTLRREGLTLLVVEQDVERALDLVDEVHVLERGCFALSGPSSRVREDPRLRKLYIGGDAPVAEAAHAGT